LSRRRSSAAGWGGGVLGKRFAQFPRRRAAGFHDTVGVEPALALESDQPVDHRLVGEAVDAGLVLEMAELVKGALGALDIVAVDGVIGAERAFQAEGIGHRFLLSAGRTEAARDAAVHGGELTVAVPGGAVPGLAAGGSGLARTNPIKGIKS